MFFMWTFLIFVNYLFPELGNNRKGNHFYWYSLVLYILLVFTTDQDCFVAIIWTPSGKLYVPLQEQWELPFSVPDLATQNNARLRNS